MSHFQQTFTILTFLLQTVIVKNTPFYPDTQSQHNGTNTEQLAKSICKRFEVQCKHVCYAII